MPGGGEVLHLQRHRSQYRQARGYSGQHHRLQVRQQPVSDVDEAAHDGQRLVTADPTSCHHHDEGGGSCARLGQHYPFSPTECSPRGAATHASGSRLEGVVHSGAPPGQARRDLSGSSTTAELSEVLGCLFTPDAEAAQIRVDLRPRGHVDAARYGAQVSGGSGVALEWLIV